MNKAILRLISFLVPALFFAACVSYDKFDTSTVEGSFGLAEALNKDSRYEEALLQYRDVKNKYPYSKYATEAELQIGEIHYKKDSFPEAQSAFILFKELHPKHPKIDYVTFKIGESIFKQLPSTVDRDLTLAPQAINQYQIVIQNYPNSQFRGKAQKRVQEITDKMAEKELYIADFYFRTKVFLSALSRYEKFLAEYPNHRKLPYVLLRAGLSAGMIDKGEKRSAILRSLIEKFPESPEAGEAKKVL